MLGLVLDGLLATLLIGPPTVSMGAAIPLLTQALARDLDDATRVHAMVYGFNTTGAFAGALAAGFWPIAALGLVGVLVAMAVLNLAAGATFVLIARRAELAGLDVPANGPAPRLERFALYAAVALLTGFSMTTLQAVLIRMGGSRSEPRTSRSRWSSPSSCCASRSGASACPRRLGSAAS